MPFKFGATDLKRVIYNGVELSKVIYNGTTIFEPVLYYGYNSPNLYKYSLNLATLLATGNETNLFAYGKVEVIVSDATHLYFYSDNTERIHKVLKTLPTTQVAQTGTTVAQFLTNRAFMAIDGTNIYSINSSSDRRLSRYLTSTLAVAQAGSSSFAGSILEILVDSTYVYVLMSGVNSIQRILKSNLSSSINTLSVTAPGTFTQDADYIYAIRTNGGSFYRILKSNFSLATNVSTGFSSPTNIDRNEMCAVDGSNFYFIVPTTGTNRLIRTNLTGGSLTQSSYNFANPPRKVKLTSNKIYVACENATIVVFDKSNINSGTAFTVANPNNTAADILGFHIEEY